MVWIFLKDFFLFGLLDAAGGMDIKGTWDGDWLLKFCWVIDPDPGFEFSKGLIDIRDMSGWGACWLKLFGWFWFEALFDIIWFIKDGGGMFWWSADCGKTCCCCCCCWGRPNEPGIGDCINDGGCIGIDACCICLFCDPLNAYKNKILKLFLNIK